MASSFNFNAPDARHAGLINFNLRDLSGDPAAVNVIGSMASVKKTIVAGTSTLLATGSSTMSGRKTLIVENLGSYPAYITSSNSATAEGLELLPGQTRQFLFDETASSAKILYINVRNSYSTEVRITEA